MSYYLHDVPESLRDHTGYPFCLTFSQYPPTRLGQVIAFYTSAEMAKKLALENPRKRLHDMTRDRVTQ